MGKITYTDKVTMNENPNIPAINKVQATDMNEIKTVVNSNDDNTGTLSNLKTTNKSSVVSALNEIYNDIFYSSGDTYTIPGQLYVSGALFGSRNVVAFTVFLPKRLDNISSTVASGLNVAVRHTGGGYWVNGDIADANVTVVSFTNNYVTITIDNSTASGTNNTPCNVYIRSLTLTFS